MQAVGVATSTTWFERVVAKTRIPYQLFFVLEGCLLYGAGLVLAGLTDNLLEFITEPKWAYFIALQAAAGTVLFYTLRKFDSSLDRLNVVVEWSEEQYADVKRRLRGIVTMPLYWVVFVLLLSYYLVGMFTIGSGFQEWGDWSAHFVWWSDYNSPAPFYLYYEIIGLLWLLVGSIYLYVVAVGLNIAYSKLCFQTPFHEMPLLTLGTRPFNGFARLTIITFICLVIGSLSYLYLFKPLASEIWTPSVSLPIGVMFLLVLGLPAIIIPHYCFYRLFSGTKNRVLNRIESEIIVIIPTATPVSKKQERQLTSLRNTQAAIEAAKVSLVNVRIVVEFAAVSCAHLALMQLVPHL